MERQSTREVAVVGIGHSRFGNLSDQGLVDLMGETALRAFDDCGLSPGPGAVDQLLVANMGGGIVNHETGIASAVASTLNLVPTPAELVENGPASGASAIKLGHGLIAGGMCDTVLVVGGEIMKAVSGSKATDFVATLLHPSAEYMAGMTLPGFAGMFTRLYMQRYGLTDEQLSAVAVKDHENALLNPYAHLHKEVQLSDIWGSPKAEQKNTMIADPLRLYSMCPVSDGAAAVLLCAVDSPQFRKLSRHPSVVISGIASATDLHCVQERADPLRLDAVRISGQKAYRMAEITPDEISFAELHDAFVILELAIAEEIGLFARGFAGEAALAGETGIDGSIPINTSGGLKAKGHPLGATGVSQVFELVKQLRGEAEPGRQVADPLHGIAVNFGGFGNNVVATICSREEI